MKNSNINLRKYFSSTKTSKFFFGIFLVACSMLTNGTIAASEKSANKASHVFRNIPNSAEKTDDEILDLELKYWIRNGGNGENRSNREIAAERIRANFAKPVDTDEPHDMRFMPADLDLSGLELTSLPAVFDLAAFKVNLLSLNLENNHLQELPEAICGLENLQVLCVNENQLVTLPESIENLSHLYGLYAGGNQIVVLPESLGNLKNLGELALIYNQLEALPDTMGNLISLSYLDLRGNKLTDLPEWLENLTMLQYFDISENQFVIPFE